MNKMRKIASVCLVILLIFSMMNIVALPKVKAATTIYYFSSTGIDSNNGLSKDFPKKSLSLIQSLLSPGVTILLKRGDSWYDPGFSWSFTNKAGTAQSPMVIGAYGDANLPRPIVAQMVKNDVATFTSLGNDIYTVKQYNGYTSDNTFRLYVGGIPLPKVPTTADLVNNTYCVASGGIINIKSSTFKNYAYVESIQKFGNEILTINNCKYLTMQDLDIKGTASWLAVRVKAPNDHLTFDNIYLHQIRNYGIQVCYASASDSVNKNTNISILNSTVDKTWSTAMNSEYKHTVGGSGNGAGGEQPGGDGITFNSAVDGAVVRNTTVTNFGHSAIGNQIDSAYLNTPGPNGIKQGVCYVPGTNNILIEQCTLSAGTSSYSRGFAFAGPADKCTGIIIRRNYIVNTNIGNHFGGYKNYIYSNIFDTLTPSTATDANNAKYSGIAIDSMMGLNYGSSGQDLVMKDCVITNNTFKNAEAFFYFRWPAADPAIMSNNIFANNIMTQWRAGYDAHGNAAISQLYSYFPYMMYRNNGLYDSDSTYVLYNHQYPYFYDINFLNTYEGSTGNFFVEPTFLGGKANDPTQFKLSGQSPLKYLNGGISLSQLLPAGIDAVDFEGKAFAEKPSIGAYQYDDVVQTTITANDAQNNAVENNGFSNGNVTLKVVCFSQKALTKDGKSMTWPTSNVVSSEGKYVVTASGTQSVSFTFTIDKILPTVNGVVNNGCYSMAKTITYSDANGATALLNGQAIQSGTTVSIEGNYLLQVTDTAGNQVTINFIIDQTPPVITGVKNVEIYNSNRTITYSDTNISTATLDGASFVSGTQVSFEGKHTLVVSDKAGNVTQVIFTIDKTLPVVSGVSNNGVYNTDKVIAFSDGTASLDGDIIESGFVVTKEGEHLLMVIDDAGNQVNIKFTIDKTPPEVLGVVDGTTYDQTVTITFNEGTATLNGNMILSGKVVNVDGEYTLVISDSIGNRATIHFALYYPTKEVKGVVDGGIYSTDRTIIFIEGVYVLLDDVQVYSGTVISSEGVHTIIFMDDLGTTTNITFTIDKTKPVVSGIVNNGLYNANKTITFNEGSATLNGNAFASGNVVSVEGVYTLVVTDAAGNITTVDFTIDKTAPLVTGVVMDDAYNTDKTITFNEGSATLNGNAFTSGSIVSVEGVYTLVVTDAAGNITTVTFMIDRKAPVLSGVTNNAFYNVDKTVTVTEDNLLSKTATKDGATYTWPLTNKFTTAGKYVLTVTDTAGNKTTVTFTIDKTLPTITGRNAAGTIVVNNGFTSSASVTLSVTEANISTKTITKNGTAISWPSTNKLTLEGKYIVTVIDKAGNKAIYTVTIDRTAPKIVVKNASGIVIANYGSSKTTKLTVTITELNLSSKTITRNGTIMTWPSTSTLTVKAKYVITITDKAGNKATFTVTLK